MAERKSQLEDENYIVFDPTLSDAQNIYAAVVDGNKDRIAAALQKQSPDKKLFFGVRRYLPRARLGDPDARGYDKIIEYHSRSPKGNVSQLVLSILGGGYCFGGFFGIYALMNFSARAHGVSPALVHILVLCVMAAAFGLFILPVLLDIKSKCAADATLLHVAVAEGQVEIVKYLIQSKSAKKNVKDGFGYTPLRMLKTRKRVFSEQKIDDITQLLKGK